MPQNKLRRMAAKLTKAIEQCPGILFTGCAVIKTRNANGPSAYINRQRIQQIINKKYTQ